MKSPRAARWRFAGKGICRWCGEKVQPPRRSWCSQKCVDDYWIAQGGPAARRAVEERDKGVCALCGLDTAVLAARVAELQKVADYHGNATASAAERLEAIDAVLLLLLKHRYIAVDPATPYQRREATMRWRCWWEADHIVPVVEGGGGCGLENLRTLCKPCHHDVTAELNRRRAAERRAAKQPTLPGVAGGASR